MVFEINSSNLPYSIDNLQKEKVINVINSISDLPATPATFMKVRKTVNNPRSSIKELSSEVTKDQALTSKILKIANSAYYGFPRKITNVSDAIILMGFQKTWYLAMSVSMMNIFKKDSKIYNREIFWEHSIKVGLCAQIIAKTLRYSKPSELYTVGLLHDLGKLILDQYFHDSFIKILKMVKEQSSSFTNAEISILGVDHAIIGAWLLDKWKFPELIIEGVVFHHLVDDKLHSKVSYMVALADNLCLIRGIGLSCDKNLMENKFKLIKKLNLNENKLLEIEKRFDDATKKISIREEEDVDNSKS